MEVVNKKGETIKTEPKKVSCREFLKIITSFNNIRVGVEGGDPPFDKIYLEIKKSEAIEAIRMNRMEVTYSIMYNSKIDISLEDTLYIHKLRNTLLD